MRMYDLIAKKRNGGELTDSEIKYMISGYVNGEIPDYQMSAMLMAIYFKSMTDREIAVMTDIVAHSGDMVDLSSIDGIKVDKHSTGGVGDKTTLIVVPIVSACGVKVAKMSGRGLGHTGGTVDKLESIPNFKTTLSRQEFFDIVNRIGVCVIGQSGNLAPADKKLYALRDVTATVDSIPLIAVSIMSKKLAAGNDCILLDVKTGSGAFMKTLDDSILLAQKMVSIGESAGKKTVALITNMDIPLGNAIGNSLEVKEAVATLNGIGPKDLTEICLNLAANMIYLAGKGDIQHCMDMAKYALDSKKALNKFIEMVKAQGGDTSVIENTENFEKAAHSYEVKLDNEGYICNIDTEKCGIASVILGAGRKTKNDPIDFSAGIIMNGKIGDYVSKSDVIATMYSSDINLFKEASQMLKDSITLSFEKPQQQSLIYARVEKNKVERFR